MKRRQMVLLIVLCLLGCTPNAPSTLPPRSPYACTGFAAYAQEPIYGMNFDYPDVELHFTLTQHGDLRVFEMTFADDESFVPTVGMNSEGLFSSMQMLYPTASPQAKTDDRQLYIWNIYGQALYGEQYTDAVLDYLDGKQLIPGQISLHTLIADSTGQAVVIEPGEDGDIVTTEIDGPFLVMTNFPNGDFQDRPYSEVQGTGAARYIAAYTYIRDHLDGFGVHEGMAALQAALSGGDWSTRCSTVYLPESNEVYIAVRQDFEHLWRVSLNEGTIESTWPQGSLITVLNLDQNGVTASELEEAVLTRPPGSQQTLVIWISVSAIAVGALCILVGVWLHKRQQKIL